MKNKKDSLLYNAWGLFVKLFVSIVLCFAVNMIFNNVIEDGSKIGLALMQIFELIICGGLVYGFMWKLGTRDLNKVNFNRIKRDDYKGLKVSTVAISPNILFYIIVVALKLAKVYNNTVYAVYKLLNIYFVPALFRKILTLDILENVSTARVLLSGLCLLFVPAVAEAAYLFGLNGISLTERLIYKNKQEKNN